MKQSADRCCHGPITKAGNSRARWMLTHGVQHLARNPGPLGVFYRRLCKRKNRNVAVTAVARKLVTIAYLMMRNNETYRYALPQATDRKLARVRYASTGVRRKADRAAAAKPAVPAGESAGRPGLWCTRSPPEVYRDDGLPPAKTMDELPAGERCVQEAVGVTGFVRQLQESPPAAVTTRAGPFFSPGSPDGGEENPSGTASASSN